MVKAGDISRKILIWSYERGSLQYYIICALILAFIFLVPPSCFLKKQVPQNTSPETAVPAGSPGETK